MMTALIIILGASSVATSMILAAMFVAAHRMPTADTAIAQPVFETEKNMGAARIRPALDMA